MASYRTPLLALLVLLVLPCRVGAQDLPGWDPDFGTPTLERRLSIGLDIGMPLVFGVSGGYQFGPHVSGFIGVAALGDFTALSSELRLSVTRFEMTMPEPFVAFGFTQYYLSDGPAETSPITAHIAAGAEYVFTSFFGVGARLGYMDALGGSQDRSVDRYGISDDVASMYFSVGGRYLF